MKWIKYVRNKLYISVAVKYEKMFCVLSLIESTGMSKWFRW